MFRGLEHTAIASPDPKQLAQWYVEHLEFRIAYEYDGNYFIKASNGTVIEIVQSQGPRAESKLRDPGIRHLAIQVDNFDIARQRLLQAGIRFLGEPVVSQGNHVLFFADADGNFLHLIHREKPLP